MMKGPHKNQCVPSEVTSTSESVWPSGITILTNTMKDCLSAKNFYAFISEKYSFIFLKIYIYGVKISETFSYLYLK